MQFSGWSVRRRIVVVFAALCALAWTASAVLVLRTASREYRGRPSPVLRTRLDHAVGLFARGVAPVVVVTGGIAEGDTASEAAVSRVYALAAGVPDSAILLENEGRTTGQSLTRVARLLKARRIDTVIVVSDPFHVLRAELVAEREGLTAYSSPTRTTGVWRRVVNQPAYFLGETVKAPLALFIDW
jgi:uncharacterized SAM-binding protein YcdF (DUF218 family)